MDLTAGKIWKVDACIGMMGDPYIGATELDGGQLGNGLLLVSHFLGLEDDDRVKAVAASLRDAVPWAQTQTKDAKEFTDAMGKFKDYLRDMQIGTPYIIPGGWVGKLSRNAVVYIVEKTAADEYSFTVCNRGPGSDYHPTDPTQLKMKVQSCATIAHVPASRMLDLSFWSLAFSLWLKNPPSEYHRMETLYDVLLPWLADSVLPLAFATSPDAYFCSPQRSNTGFVKNVVEAAKFLLLKRGLSAFEIKRIMFRVRWNILKQMRDDLIALDDPTLPFKTSAVEAIQALAGISLIDSLQGSRQLPDVIADAPVIGVYFASLSCPACKTFRTKLIRLCESLTAAGRRIAIIVVPLDSTDEEYQSHLMSLPVSWACVPIVEMAARKKLVQAFHVSKMPLLVVMDATGAVKTPLGVELVLQDPIGAHYPWVASDTFQLPLPTLSDTEGACINMALKQTGLSAIKQNTAGGLLTDDLVAVHELIQDVDAKRALIAAKTPAPEDTSKWQFDRQVPLLPFEHMEHFKPANVDGYAGNVAEAVVPVLASMLDVPERVGTIELAAAAFIRCEGVCQSLLQRAGDGSSSSRVALHHEVIQLVTTLFTETIPVPSIADDDMWRQPVGKELQFGVLKSVHNLVLILGIVWQSIERPSRSLDATRALASICALAMYDAMLRAVAVDTPMEMSLLMAEGYVLANSFCQNSRTLLETARAMELVQPSFAVVRGRVLAYFASLNALTPLFELRMPDEKVELKKYSTTFGFLRKLMELYNYPLIAPDDANPPSEMEALVDWFLSDSTPLAETHPEMAQTRDLVTMCKFLCTMETREDELMRRRTGLRQWQMWSLTFDEATSRYGRRFNISRNFLAGKLKWEVAGFRGIDQDIADIDVSGFTQRKLFFGEGPVVVSPASLPPLLQTSLPVVTEDDVMHTDALPLFQGTLSSEESEYLLSYLTVPYTRIPLVLGFFASRDRVMYLFNPLLQTLLRAVLFEGGDWVLRTSGESSAEMITHVPLRKSGLVLQEEALEQVLDARVHHQKAADHLGTMNGLLLNELSHAPEATVRPILIMLQAITELGEASVHSSDASFILYMLQLSVDVLRYVTFAVYEHTHVSATTLATLQALRSELVGQLFGFGLTTLDKWRMEAEAKDDLRTACVIHSYMALLFMNLRVDEYTPARLVTLLGSVAYVRNWHCFGMHVLLEDESELSSEQRLLRWLQAHGIDTKNVATGSLDKYLTDRPVFLKVGMEIIQAPSILKKKPKEDATTVLYPPAGVLESELFELLQAKRRSIVEFAQSLSPNDCNALLNSILHIALRAKTVPTHEWTMDAGVAGTGRYVCTQAEMKIDLQTGEILWRNDELKPVPDSMVQFSDYRHHFGNEALHCGLVARQAHRLWVHVIGTECELMEWDEPSPDDQGVDTPTVFLPPVPAATPAVPSDAKMYWECPACTCANFNGDQPNAACEVCATPKHVPAPTPAPAQPAEPTETGFLYLGTEYSRRLDPYSKDEHEIESELWFVSLVRSVVNALFPEDDPAKKLPFSLFLPTSVAPETAPHVTLLALHKNDKSDFLSTFKEMIVYRHYNVLHVFSLISHGRRLHRKLLFTSNARLALHSFVPNVEGAGESVAPSVQYAAGDIMELQSSGNSLVILRRNKSLHGVETYLPPRFLQGLIPSAFLEAFKFWQGEDGILRGEPLDDESQWFKYQLEIQLKHNKVAYVVRKAIDAAPTLIQHTSGQPSVIAPPPAPIAVPPTPPPMRQEMVIADEDVVQLMSLGFSYSGCVLALKESGNSVEEAAMWLLDEANQTRILQADEIPEEALEASLREQQLVEAVMAASSVSRIAATYALELFNHDDTLATAWLCEPDNADEIARMEADTRGGDADTSLPNAPRLAKQASEGEQADAKRVKMTHGGELVLLNPLHIASPDSTMARIAHVLGRIEDLSHVLIWTATLPTALLQHETESDPVGELSQIALIELPRLKLRFEPRRGDDGRVHLYMVDQREWFICLDDMSKLSAPLRALATSMPDAVVLATSRDEYRFLCANHDVYRPMVQGVPFSTVVVPNRASAGWQQVMETRYYLYPVHASQTFVLTPSLSSTLYLILLALMNRQYKSAAQYIATCHVDVPFTDEEQWIFNQIEKTLQDRHPDACACRVRLALAIQYSENKCSWRLADELHVVSTSVAHVQAECRLNAQEELDALALCENMSPLLQVRMALCVAEQRKQMDTDVKPARLRVGGQPWVKLNMLTAAYLEEHATTLSTVRYKRPSALLADEECMKLIWDNEIVGDEASGANRGLGCLFLYECLNGHVSLRLHGEEYTRSMADLLARFLHLKLARWGKEVVEDGEEECSVSIAMSQVAVVLSNPYHAWPALPVDRDSTHMLERGVNLYSKHLKDSMLKNFFDMTTMEFQTLLVANSDRVIPPLRQQLTHAHKTLPETVRRARAGAFPFPLAVKPSDASCAERVFTRCHDALHPFVPLSFFRAEDYVVHCRPERELATQLPFDLSAHAAAQSVVAKDLLQRLADDVKNHAETTNHTLEPFFVGVSRHGFDGATCVAKLETLVAASHAQRTKDEAFVLATIATLEARVNVVAFSVNDAPSTRLAKCRFLVERFAQQHTPIDFAYLASTLASSDMAGDLARKNPFVDVAQLPMVLQLVQLVLFCANRMSHLNRLIGSAAALKSLVESHVLYQNQDASRMLHASQDVANGLLASRHYLKARDGQTYAYDPRYLLFEFVFELLLRQRQVEMVESFMTSMHNGVSRVQQMIMGAGKTTVVGPLLTYMLADSKVLVTHVMPTALLEQSRAVLRSRFSNAILQKRIFTLSFDRSVDDDPIAILALASKLQRACVHGDVICASPEAIKSLLLKFVELLHSLEQSTHDPDFRLQDTSRTGMRIRKVLHARADMADELQVVLRQWQRGVLIMDEVDVLLHPLRSELNFPIGNKFPIDLAANRWELPMHLLDVVLSSSSSSPLHAELHQLLHEGYTVHALQRFPHLVLLDVAYYDAKLRPILARVAYEWLLHHFKMGKCTLSMDDVIYYLQCDRVDLGSQSHIENGLSEHGLKLLNLGREWIRTLLPHCLSKINRVSYGLLQKQHFESNGNTPSRLLLAVPFVGKDVPSRSSEFAHPDVLIGLTILAYRYEGVRRTDIKTVVAQLKHDFSRQLGPREQRPACALFRSWVLEGLALAESTSGVLPLPLFQLNDASQVTRLLQLVRLLPSVVHYYVRQHVFPSCMNFQKLKVSACGHELGSDSLFAKRIGFSGTPSNLLPLDLGDCHYEPQSDGNIFSVLTSARVTTLERKLDWTATSLLRDIATHDPPFHALIDTGALITGLDNEEVARFLLTHLPLSMEGVVYLDPSDRQMILLRDHAAAMPLVQCGLGPEKRFTFYDQVHTTGMDIKQCTSARAVLTLGKDMTFRDYAQGAYRMRGIGAGQTIHLYLIPEVENRIRQEVATGPVLLDDFRLLVPAWLLVNSMKMESMQLVQLSLQELHNTWRKRALYALLDEVDAHRHGQNATQRLLRFQGNDWLRQCIDAFRVQVSYAVAAQLPLPKAITDTMAELTAAHAAFVQTPAELARIETVQRRVSSLSGHVAASSDMHLNAEVVHENEAEAEEEAEEEAEQEEQKMSAYTRDDEHPVPWSTDALKEMTGDSFYPMARFQAHTACPSIAFPASMLVSDNYFRPRWIGLGERRLKNVGFLMEWHPLQIQNRLRARITALFVAICAQQPGIAPTDAAAQAIQLASQSDLDTPDENEVPGPVYVVALSLAEGETLRRMIHCAHPIFAVSGIQLRTADGALVEASHASSAALTPTVQEAIECFRFFNGEMYYTAPQMDHVLAGLADIPLHLRHEFFMCCLRLRRRERQLWGDTPLAKVFTKSDEWHLLSARAKMEQFQRGIRTEKIPLLSSWHRFDGNNDSVLSYDELLRCFESFQLGFSPSDLNEIIGLVETAHEERGVSIAKLCAAFHVDPTKEHHAAKTTTTDDDALWMCSVCTYTNEPLLTACAMCSEPRDKLAKTPQATTWTCENCTCVNPILETTCSVCEMGMSGRREVPKDKWVCDPDQGGCTFFNPLSSFYCDVCNRARPDLASHRF